jgi:hypothetical protein
VTQSGTNPQAGPAWWEWLEQRPVGIIGGVVVAIGWTALILAWWSGIWPLEVAFFLAVGWLTLTLSALSGFSALVSFSSRHQGKPTTLFKLPDRLQDFEDYFRWLTPVVFVVGIILGHYFWH